MTTTQATVSATPKKRKTLAEVLASDIPYGDTVAVKAQLKDAIGLTNAASTKMENTKIAHDEANANFGALTDRVSALMEAIKNGGNAPQQMELQIEDSGSVDTEQIQRGA